MCPKNGSSLDLDPDPMDLMDLRLTGFGSRSNPSISYTVCMGVRTGVYMVVIRLIAEPS